jgi:hypothetical protein
MMGTEIRTDTVQYARQLGGGSGPPSPAEKFSEASDCREDDGSNLAAVRQGRGITRPPRVRRSCIAKQNQIRPIIQPSVRHRSLAMIPGSRFATSPRAEVDVNSPMGVANFDT